MDRTVLHVDCNNFFASVELLHRPELRDVPMAVAGDEEARRGIILAKNQVAKELGIVTAQTVWSAKKKCPSLVLVPPRHGEYARVSRLVREIFARYTDRIEPFGIDEAWLDVTGSRTLFGDGKTIAERIRKEVKAEIGITVSVGVSFNKIFAKLGSDYKKPDAVTVIGREDVARIAYPLPVGDLLFVGRHTQEALEKYNIRTIGDLAAASPAFLTSRFGKAGAMLSRYARGEDDSPVSRADEREDAKSVSRGMTFRHDLVLRDELSLGVRVLSEDVAARLRKTGVKCTAVGVTVKDELLRSVSRQVQLDTPSDLAREIGEAALALVLAVTRGGKRVRMISVCAMGLLRKEDATEQLALFDGGNKEKREKQERLEHALDGIRARYGSHAVQSGDVLGNDIGIESEKEETKQNGDRGFV